MSTKVKSKLKEMAETPEAKTAKRLNESIERKLNFDNKWAVINPLLAQSRLASLTCEELEYWGRLKGFNQPFCGGIDWDSVSDIFLSECMMLPEKRIMNTLSYGFPSPDRKPVFDAADKSNSGDIEAYLSGDLAFDELATMYPAEGAK